MANKPMTLLLIEDNINDCNTLINYAKTRKDVTFVAVTDSDIEGLKYVKKYQPEGIILDLELSKGSGNSTSFGFLETLKNTILDIRPKIIVTTNISSDSVHNIVYDHGVELIMYKKQPSYSPASVIDHMLLLRESKPTISEATLNFQTPENMKKNITEKINEELNLIGVGPHLQGRKYLYDAIYYLITNEQQIGRPNVVQYLVNIYKRSNSTISRAMQNAILHAWRVTSLEDLSRLYTARINYDTGVPTPTEFIFYYMDKIKKMI